MKRRGVRIAVIAGAGVLCIAGLAAGLSILGTQEEAMPEGPSATFEESPDRTPTADDAVVSPADASSKPQSRIPLKCEQLVQPSIVDAALGTAMRFSAPRLNVAEAAVVQGGGLQCAWNPVSGEARTNVAVAVLPDIPERFLSNWPIQQSESERYNTVGDRSIVTCSIEPGLDCMVTLLVDDYWVDLALYNPNGPGEAEAEFAAAHSVANNVVSALRAVGPALAAWEAHEGALAAESSCETIDDLGAIAAALPELQLQGPGTIGRGVWSGIVPEAWARAGFDYCAFGSVSGGVELFVLPGGSWAWSPERFESNNVDPSWVPSVQAADDAVAGCVDRYNSELLACTIAVSAGRSLLEFTAMNVDMAQAQDLTQIAAEAWLAAYAL